MTDQTLRVGHTPGPWKPLWDESTGEVFIAPVDSTNAIVGTKVAELDSLEPISREELGANARLIAAAPDLLKALRDLMKAEHRPQVGPLTYDSLREDAWAAADAAINKAEGRTP